VGEKLRPVLGAGCICLALGLALGLFLPDLLQETQTVPQSDWEPAEPPEWDLRLDLNTATAGQLEELPGIGSVLADRILEYREKNGPFQTVWELTAVDGVGESKTAGLLPYVTVSEKEK